MRADAEDRPRALALRPERPHLPAVAEADHPNLTGAVVGRTGPPLGDDQQPAVGAEPHQSGRLAGLADGAESSAGRRVPQVDPATRIAGHDGPSVRRDRQREFPVAVGHGPLGAGGRVPHPHPPALARRQQRLAVGQGVQAARVRAVAGLQPRQFLAGRHVPPGDVAVGEQQKQGAAVGGEPEGGGPAAGVQPGVGGEHRLVARARGPLAGGGGPEVDAPAVAGDRRNGRPVRGERHPAAERAPPVRVLEPAEVGPGPGVAEHRLGRRARALRRAEVADEEPPVRREPGDPLGLGGADHETGRRVVHEQPGLVGEEEQPVRGEPAEARPPPPLAAVEPPQERAGPHVPDERGLAVLDVPEPVAGR